VEVDHLMGRWFLPDTPDVVGMLCEQLDTTLDGMSAFAAWAHGDASKSDEVRALEHQADDNKRALWRALRTAFVTPVDAEDLFVLSAGIDEILNAAKNAVRDAEVMSLAPDDAIAAMADHLVEGMGHLGEAFQHLAKSDGGATEAADAAVKCERLIEKVYRAAMPELFDHTELREVLGRRDLYERLVAIGEQMRMVAERVWYAVVKEA
jgi:uncharacterized protein Yka (UPF0111/DUF47 family)